MSDDTDTTLWSLPGQMDVPRDELKVQMEVYEETILLRGFEDGANWVRTVSADGIASAFTQHLGFSSGLLPKEILWWSQGETGQVVALWRPPKVWPVTAVPTTPPDVDCAAALDFTDQDPTINQVMASLVLQVVRRMVAGTCPFMGLYLDMEQGTVNPTYATPEAMARVVGTSPETLTGRAESPEESTTH